MLLLGKTTVLRLLPLRRPLRRLGEDRRLPAPEWLISPFLFNLFYITLLEKMKGN